MAKPFWCVRSRKEAPFAFMNFSKRPQPAGSEIHTFMASAFHTVPTRHLPLLYIFSGSQDIGEYDNGAAAGHARDGLNGMTLWNLIAFARNPHLLARGANPRFAWYI